MAELYVQDDDGKWVPIGNVTSFDVSMSWVTPPLALVDPETELQRSTYARPTDDELRDRIRHEFGV
jgi:hypothetical protein